MSLKIKFGTDGWRAIIAKEYTVENVVRVSKGVSDWLKSKKENPVVVIGHDCRFGGSLFVDTALQVFCNNGIKVLKSESFVSTPMVSYGVLHYGTDQGIVITASHNPPSYNGYKLKGAHGGPTSPVEILEVESFIPDNFDFQSQTENYWKEKGLLQIVDLETDYIEYLNNKFNLEVLRKAPYKLAYDAMFGAGQNVIKKILPNAVLLHCEVNPSFKGIAPEPLHKNLLELSDLVKNTPEVKIGLANDGDADRIALYDEEGNYVDAHHILLLLIHYLHKYKGMTGKVAIAFSASTRVEKMCELYGLECEITPIGFKHISEIMTKEDVLVGGEESGGIAIKGHIPERDGIYDGLTIYQFMIETGKTLKELIQEVYEVTGSFVYERADLTLPDEQKVAIINKAQEDGYNSFGKYTFHKTGKIDGVKYYLDNGGWVMLRASGTEPLLRIYAEGSNYEETMDILKSVKKTIGVV